MIVMDIRIDNFYAFNNFHMNMAYPKKILKSPLGNETLEGHPNFRYKKVNILMGANATGKTSFGKMMMEIFNFIVKKQYSGLTETINDVKKQAFFGIDYIFYVILCIIF